VTNRFIKLFPIYNLLFAVPSSPPESPQCDVLGSTSIYITWSPPDIDGQNGKIKGYKVFYISVDELYGKVSLAIPLCLLCAFVFLVVLSIPFSSRCHIDAVVDNH